MSNVQTAIERAAARFAHEVVRILQRATLVELFVLAGRDASLAARAEDAGGERGRRARAGRRGARADLATATVASRSRRRGTGHKRSPDEVNRLAERAFQWLQSNKGDWAVSAIADGLRVPVADLGLPLQRLRKDGRVEATGQKRSTVYHLL